MEAALHQRDADLNKAFQEGGKNVEKRLEKRGNRGRKNDFFRELICIVITDSLGNIIHGCEFKITRSKCTMDTINGMIRKSPMKQVEVEYFIDNSGTPMWPENLMLTGQKIPTYYIIIPKVKRSNKDIRSDPTYDGQVSFMLSGIPNKAKDEISEVDDKTLRAYFMCAILEVDPYSRPFYTAITETKEAMKTIDKKIKGVGKLVFFEADGTPMSDEKSEAERETLYQAYADERMICEKRLKSKEMALEKQIAWRNTMKMDFTKVSHDANTDTCTWQVKLYGTMDAEEMEDLLIAKDDWAGIKVARWCDDPKLPVWTGRGRVPDGTLNQLEPDYTMLQINVAGARIARVPNGVGTIKTLDRTSVPFHGEEFGMYYGEFEVGKKHGKGIEVNDAGIFVGRYIEGAKDGPGRWDLADGTTIVGSWECLQQRKYQKNPWFDNPYLDGEPQGEVEILFSDGALYKGQVINGQIHGKGQYESAFGEIMVGNFTNGLLDGDNCYFRNNCGEKFAGQFRTGEMHGLGKYLNERKDFYDGFWDSHMRSGRGVARYKNRGNYIGYFCNDMRHGKGELYFTKRPKQKKKVIVSDYDKKKQAEEEKKKLEKESAMNKKAHLMPKQKEKSEEEEKQTTEERMYEFINVYQGYFFADAVGGGGIQTNIDKHTSFCISRRDKRKLVPILNVIHLDQNTVKATRRQVPRVTYPF